MSVVHPRSNLISASDMLCRLLSRASLYMAILERHLGLVAAMMQIGSPSNYSVSQRCSRCAQDGDLEMLECVESHVVEGELRATNNKNVFSNAALRGPSDVVRWAFRSVVGLWVPTEGFGHSAGIPAHFPFAVVRYGDVAMLQ